jgi:hypothetical protein
MVEWRLALLLMRRISGTTRFEGIETADHPD